MPKTLLNFLQLDLFKGFRNASSLKKLAIRGAVWTVAGYGISQLLRLGGNLILTRLLAPQIFGLMALVYTFITSIHLFSDIGLSTSIVQNKRGNDPVFLNTAWTMQVIRGFLIWFVSLLVAYPIAKFYGESQLLWLIPVVGFSSIIDGFTSTSVVTLNRELMLGKLTVFETGMQIISLILTIVWVWLSHSIWALVGANLLAGLLRMVITHLLFAEAFPRFTWEKQAVKELFELGKWLFISTAMTFLAESSDRVLLGKLFSFEMLGVYVIAATLSTVPKSLILMLSNKVIFPSYSKAVDLPRNIFLTKIHRNRWPILLTLALSLALLVSFGDILVLALFDKRYTQAAWMLPILALGIWPSALALTIDPALFAIGKPLYVAYGNFFKFLFTFGGILLGSSLAGVLGAVVVVAFNDIPFWCAVNYGLQREELTSINQDLKATTVFLVLLIAILAIRALLGFGSPISKLL